MNKSTHIFHLLLETGLYSTSHSKRLFYFSMDVLCMLEPCVKQKLGKPREGFGLGNHFVIYRGICLLWEEMIGIRADGILLDMN